MDWEKVQKENELIIEELRTLINKADIWCPECGSFVQKKEEVTKRKKYFAFGHCAICNIQIRHISRVTHKNGAYSIVSNNTIYSTEEVLD